MHHDAEYGVAAHWVYKEKAHAKRDVAHERKIAWLRQMLEEPQPDDPESFVAILKADVLQDRVYTFTPKGDIIDLPVGSTPIDFAYSVHTDVGNRCRGAKVNGKLVTLDYRLKTGDTVDILTTKQGGPSRDWLNSSLGLVQTQRAKSKIRQWFKRQDWELNLTQGKIQLDREFRKLGMSEFDLDNLAKEFDYRSVDDLYAGIGCGDVSVGRIINKISESDKGKMMDILSVSPPSQSPDKVSPDSVTVLGLKGILTSIAKCCKPAPGDEIIGYITRGRGATIHRRDCPNILRLNDNERIVKVSWGEPQRTYPVSVEIKAYDRQGLMVDISNVLNNEGVNLLDIGLKVSHNLAAIKLVLEVGDISQLSRLLARIENLPNVMEAHRLKPG
jgi:GTP pyrophosphokinase